MATNIHPLGDVAAANGTPSRDRLLAAAKQLFAARGYDNTSTAAIARAAGTSESQLIKHFGGKEGLLAAIFDQGWDRLGYVLRAIQELPSPTDKLRTLLDLFVRGLERDPELRQILLLEGRRIRKEGKMVVLTRGYMELVQTIDGALEQMRTSGELRPDLHPEAVRSALMGMFEGLMRDRVLAEKVEYPAGFSGEELHKIFDIVLPAFLAR